MASLSSGMKAIPAFMAERGSPARTGLPATVIVPLDAARRPEIVSASSRWPLPATPATATISPARTDSETPRTASSPRLPDAQMSSSSSIGPVGSARGLRSASPTSRPTISDASERGVDSAVEAVATDLPPRSTVTRSETAVTSFSLCEMKITVRPSSAICRIVPKSTWASWGVSTAVGSSRISTRASR